MNHIIQRVYNFTVSTYIKSLIIAKNQYYFTLYTRIKYFYEISLCY